MELNRKVMKLVSDRKRDIPNSKYITVCQKLFNDEDHTCCDDESCTSKEQKPKGKKKINITPYVYAPFEETIFELKHSIDGRQVLPSGQAGMDFLYEDGLGKLENDATLVKAKSIVLLWKYEFSMFESLHAKLLDIAEDCIIHANENSNKMKHQSEMINHHDKMINHTSAILSNFMTASQQQCHLLETEKRINNGHDNKDIISIHISGQLAAHIKEQLDDHGSQLKAHKEQLDEHGNQLKTLQALMKKLVEQKQTNKQTSLTRK